MRPARQQYLMMVAPLLLAACSGATAPAEADTPENGNGSVEASAAAGADEAPERAVACSPAESQRIAAVMQETAQFTLRLLQSSSFDGFEAVQQKASALSQSLSPSCFQFMDRLGKDLAARSRSGSLVPDRYARLSGQNIYHDQATDTFIAPGFGSCSPTGCLTN